MKCPGCDFVCSELRDICPRCLVDLRPHKKLLGLPIVKPNATYAELCGKKTSSPAKKRTPGIFKGIVSGVTTKFFSKSNPEVSIPKPSSNGEKAHPHQATHPPFAKNPHQVLGQTELETPQQTLPVQTLSCAERGETTPTRISHWLHKGDRSAERAHRTSNPPESKDDQLTNIDLAGLEEREAPKPQEEYEAIPLTENYSDEMNDLSDVSGLVAATAVLKSEGSLDSIDSIDSVAREIASEMLDSLSTQAPVLAGTEAPNLAEHTSNLDRGNDEVQSASPEIEATSTSESCAGKIEPELIEEDSLPLEELVANALEEALRTTKQEAASQASEHSDFIFEFVTEDEDTTSTKNVTSDNTPSLVAPTANKSDASPSQPTNESDNITQLSEALSKEQDTSDIFEEALDGIDVVQLSDDENVDLEEEEIPDAFEIFEEQVDNSGSVIEPPPSADVLSPGSTATEVFEIAPEAVDVAEGSNSDKIELQKEDTYPTVEVFEEHANGTNIAIDPPPSADALSDAINTHEVFEVAPEACALVERADGENVETHKKRIPEALEVFADENVRTGSVIATGPSPDMCSDESLITSSHSASHESTSPPINFDSMLTHAAQGVDTDPLCPITESQSNPPVDYALTQERIEEADVKIYSIDETPQAESFQNIVASSEPENPLPLEGTSSEHRAVVAADSYSPTPNDFCYAAHFEKINTYIEESRGREASTTDNNLAEEVAYSAASIEVDNFRIPTTILITEFSIPTPNYTTGAAYIWREIQPEIEEPNTAQSNESGIPFTEQQEKTTSDEPVQIDVAPASENMSSFQAPSIPETQTIPNDLHESTVAPEQLQPQQGRGLYVDQNEVMQAFIEARRSLSASTDVQEIDLQAATVYSEKDRQRILLMFSLAKESLELGDQAERFVDQVATSEGKVIENTELVEQLGKIEKHIEVAATQGVLKGRSQPVHEGDQDHSQLRYLPQSPLQNAVLMRRTVAFVIDTMMVVLCAVSFPLTFEPTESIDNFWSSVIDINFSINSLNLVVLILSCLPAVYVVLSILYCFAGTTLGTWVLGLRIMTVSGHRASATDIFVRTMFLPISTLVLGWTPALVGKATLHDKVSRTRMMQRTIM